MEKFTPPRMEIVRFDNEDVIATSGGIWLAGFRNGIASDATLTVGGKTYGNGNWNNNAIVSALLPEAPNTNPSNILFKWGGTGKTDGTLYWMPIDISDGNDESVYYTSLTNGSYVYSGESQGYHNFNKQ